MNEFIKEVLVPIAVTPVILVLDRAFTCFSVWRSYGYLTGHYQITKSLVHAAEAPVEGDELDIIHVSGSLFRIVSTGGWECSFKVQESEMSGTTANYRYADGAWGTLEMLFDKQNNEIFVYGENKSESGGIPPFSYTIKNFKPNRNRLIQFLFRTLCFTLGRKSATV